ncbi:MAG: RsmD family RNA methyltransferase [Candidatus Dojkabacteria bacterium]|nr:MAG: RsmD family RNA methyltransferase [Candidatus Dojkabacteria bacterium]
MGLKYDSLRKLRKQKHKLKADSWEEYDKHEDEMLKEMLRHQEPTVKGKVRVTGGKVRGFKIEIPHKTRPLTDRMKTRIFDILREDIFNKTVLDIYAGSGSFGFEALSRGAKEVTFVDAAKQAEKILHQNARHTGFLTETSIIREKADEYVKGAISREEQYEIIFMDPPYKLYNTKKKQAMSQLITGLRELLPGYKDRETKLFPGALIIKHPYYYPLADVIETIEGIEIMDTYRFGMNAVTFVILQ